MRSREIKMQPIKKKRLEIVLRVSHGKDDCMHIVKVSSPTKPVISNTIQIIIITVKWYFHSVTALMFHIIPIA